MRPLALRLRALIRRRRFNRDLDDELAFHLEMRAAQLEATGLDAEAAQVAARRKFGHVMTRRDEMKDLWQFATWESLWRDVRYGVRMLRRAPTFTAVVVLTIAIGIGGNTAVFSVVNAVLLRPLPFKNADRLVRFYSIVHGTPTGPSAGDLHDLLPQTHAFERLITYDTWRKNIGGGAPGAQPEQALVGLVPPEYFTILGVTPVLGRVFTDAENQVGRDHEVILTTRWWRTHFASTPTILGQTIRINDEPYTIVGVMPDVFPEWLDAGPGTIAMWTPYALPDELLGPLHHADRGGYALGVLRPGISAEAATAEVQRVAANLAAQYPADRGVGARVVPLADTRGGNLRPTLLLLMAAVALILLITCTNVAGLLVARATVRRREIVVRSSLGAGRAELTRQFLAESTILSLLGGAIGLALAWAGTRALATARPASLLELAEVRIDLPVLLYTLAISLGAGLVFGVLPILPSTRVNLAAAMREGGRSASMGRASRKERHALVVAQIACCVVLVLWTGLLVESLVQLQRQDSTLKGDHLLTAHFFLPPARYRDADAITRLCETFGDRARAIPGVVDATIATSFPPFNRITRLFTLDDQSVSRLDEEPSARFAVVDAHYRHTLGIPLIAGRDFAESDLPTNPPVVLINQTLAHRWFPGGDPLNRRLRLHHLTVSSPSDTGTVLATIIGILADTRNRGLALDPDPEILGLFRQMPDMNRGDKNIVARTTAPPMTASPAIREALRGLDPEMPLSNIASLDAIMADQTSDRRLGATLLGLFTVSGVLLAIIGIYGVVSYFVTQRTSEIGVRLTLGAQRRDVLWLVLGQGVWLAAAGIALGLAITLALAPVLSRVLFAVRVTDPGTLVGVTLLIAAIVIAACWIPAWRATRLDPILALRDT
jgi:predicted permease